MCVVLLCILAKRLRDVSAEAEWPNGLGRRGPFLESPGNLTITELFYSRIRNKNRGVYIFPFLDTDELKMALRAQKVPGLSRNGLQVL